MVALIHMFGPICGAHFNPVVTLAMTWRDRLPRNEIALYLLAQLGGAWLGVIAAHYIFSMPLFEFSTKVRSGMPLVASELSASLIR